MHLGIQAYFLHKEYTGIGVHTLGLIQALLKKKQKITVIVPRLIKGIPKKKQHVVKPKAWIPHPGLRKWYWERIQVQQAMAKINPDWEIYPYPTPLPRYSPNQRALTVHDTILWQDKRYRGGRVKQLYHRETEKALARVDQIFTVSESTKKDLDLPTAVVIGNGIPEIPNSLPKLNYENAIVYLGGYDIRKQVPQLVDAFLSANEKYQLLLIGDAHHRSKYYPAVHWHERVHHLGKLTDEQVYATLKSAKAFVHFSDAEGFNIPLLQAMKVGVPCIVRDIAVNHEVSGGSALFLDPSKPKQLSAMLKKLDKADFRKKVIADQKKAARRYSWEKTAAKLLKTLQS